MYDDSDASDLFDAWWANHASARLAEGPWPMSHEDIKEVFLAGAEAEFTCLLKGVMDDRG